jgi:hypothetical protein
MSPRTDPSPTRVARFLSRTASLPLGVALVTLVHLALLAESVHFFDQLAGWFWPIRDRVLPHPELLLGLVPLPLVALVAFVDLRGRRIGLAGRLCLLVGLGYAIQHGLALLEGRGLDALRARMLESGHGEALRAVAGGVGLRDLMTHFESHAAAGAFGRFARSKPPGFMLFYLATFRASGVFGTASVERAATLAALVWPLFAYLTVVPLFALARRSLDERRALAASALYVLVPSVDLIALHTDEAFFPLIAACVVWCAATSADPGKERRAVLAGVLGYLAGFCSFALLASLPLGAAYVLGARERRWSIFGRMTLGFVAAYAAFRLLFGYDPVAVAESAFAFHEAWRPGLGGTAGRLYYAVLAAIELAVWIGVPIACAASAEFLHALRQALRGRLRRPAEPALMLGAVLAFVLFFGAMKGEAARLCCFFVPFVVLAATARLGRLGPRFGAAAVTFAALEWATTLLSKLHQDFW